MFKIDSPSSQADKSVELDLSTRLKQLEAVRALTHEITQELDLPTLFNLIIRRAVEITAAAGSGALYLWDETDRVLISHAWYNQGDWKKTIRTQLGEGVVGTTAERQSGMIVNDYRTSPYATPLFLERFSCTAVMAEPLLYRDSLLGVLLLNNEHTGKAFTTDDSDLLIIFAAQAAIAIHNANVYETQEAWLSRLHTLTHLNQVISSSLDLEAVLREIANSASTLMNSPQVSCWMAYNTTQTLEAFAFSDAQQGTSFPARKLTFNDGGIGWVATHRQPLNVPNVFNDERFIALEWWRTFGLQSFYAVPVLQGNTLLAVIALNGHHPFRFSLTDQSLLESLVAQAASAIVNARLYRKIKRQTVLLQDANTELQMEIAERQQAQAKLQQNQKDLEWRVKERTVDLQTANNQLRFEIMERTQTEARLQAFTEQLERSNRELEDFAYVASHDLQEPLRKIQAFGDRLKAKCHDALNESGRDYLDRMQHAAKRMQTLITDLLSFSRITTQAQPFATVDLGAIAREVVSDLDIRIEELNGRVEISDLPTLDADPMQMRQLLQNLIGNALKFHKPDEPPVVQVQWERNTETTAETQDETEQNACYFTVTDNGIGFEEKYCDRIFTVFQRLHGRTAYEGTGIGLAICRKITERHGGWITAHSQPGHGTTFRVALPRTQAAENPT